ncbi:hypothetical protein [Massilia sp. METH4]|uniref:hypothetical protein n=1 Tax=Massilia sp. METH4 TaxID=3123041 RepID=UPI0030D1FA94
MANLFLYAGATARRPLFIVRGAAGEPLLAGVDRSGRLRLVQRQGAAAWHDADLTEALPGGGTSHCADVRQAPDGTIAVALSVRNAAGASTLHCGTGLPAGHDMAGWAETLRHLPAAPGLPSNAGVKRLKFGLLQAGAPPLLLIETAAAQGVQNWYCNAAAPGTLRALRLPPGAAHAIGSFRQPGVWSLHAEGKASTLRFTPLRDPFGWGVDLGYRDLPPHTRSVLLAPGTMPNVPDLYVAGEGIVVYRGGNTLPQPVAPVAGARLLWSHARDGAEYLACADGEGALWMIARPRRGAWSAPVRLTRRRAVLAVAGQFIYAAAVEEGNLEVQRFTMDGRLYDSETAARGW